jgi:hypothetical protein
LVFASDTTRDEKPKKWEAGREKGWEGKEERPKKSSTRRSRKHGLRKAKETAKKRKEKQGEYRWKRWRKKNRQCNDKKKKMDEIKYFIFSIIYDSEKCNRLRKSMKRSL